MEVFFVSTTGCGFQPNFARASESSKVSSEVILVSLSEFNGNQGPKRSPIFAAILAIIFGSVGMVIFPAFRTMYASVDTTGMLPLVAVMIKLMPYALLFVIIYGLILIFQRKSKDN